MDARAATRRASDDSLRGFTTGRVAQLQHCGRRAGLWIPARRQHGRRFATPAAGTGSPRRSRPRLKIHAQRWLSHRTIHRGRNSPARLPCCTFVTGQQKTDHGKPFLGSYRGLHGGLIVTAPSILRRRKRVCCLSDAAFACNLSIEFSGYGVLRIHGGHSFNWHRRQSSAPGTGIGRGHRDVLHLDPPQPSAVHNDRSDGR